jgi:hypothetical protein
MSKVRTRILQALNNLSNTIEWSNDYIDVYRSDEELMDKAEQLYLAVLEGIEAMMTWLDHKAYRKSEVLQNTYRTFPLLKFSRGSDKVIFPTGLIRRLRRV